jgi:hypothetical protein
MRVRLKFCLTVLPWPRVEQNLKRETTLCIFFSSIFSFYHIRPRVTYRYRYHTKYSFYGIFQLQAHRQTLERLTRRPAGGGSAATAASASVVAPPQQTSANAGGQSAVPSQGHATAASGGSSAAGNSNQCKENNRSGAGFLLPTLGMVTRRQLQCQRLVAGMKG